MGDTTRPVPGRTDRWRPADPVLDSLLRRGLADADSIDEGGSREFMAGAMILVMLGVLILIAAQSVQAAIIVPALLAGLGFLYVTSRTAPAAKDATSVLEPFGGPGRLPAGYIVHPQAWQAGVAEHLSDVPEAQLQAAAQLCRAFPGSVDDLISFTAAIAAQLPASRQIPASDVQRATRELVHVGAPILRDLALNGPTSPTSPAVPTGKR